MLSAEPGQCSSPATPSAVCQQTLFLALQRAVGCGGWAEARSLSAAIGALSPAHQHLADALGRVASLQHASYIALGPRVPWETTPSRFSSAPDRRFVVALNLGRARQLAALDGRSALARALLWREFDNLETGRLQAPRVDVAELITSPGVPTGHINVVGVARPLPGGGFAVADPGSVLAVKTRFHAPISRGVLVQVAGRWDVWHARLEGAELAAVGPRFDCAAADTLIEHLGAELKANRLTGCPVGPRQGTPLANVPTLSHPEEIAGLPQALAIFETDCDRARLSLRTLCEVHKLVARAPAGIGGKLRDGPAVVRQNGVTTYVPPSAAVARVGAETFVSVLAEYLAQASKAVPPAVLAAEAVARFTSLHPFVDGNGRIARVMATWLLLRSGYAPKPGLSLDSYCRLFQREHYWTLRHHERDPWAWQQFFFDAVTTCFLPPCAFREGDLKTFS